MNILLDDWLVIIEYKGITKIYNTELWIEWGIDDNSLSSIADVIKHAIDIFTRERINENE